MHSVLCMWLSILRLFQQLLLLHFVTVFGAWGLYILSQVLNFLLWEKPCQKLASSFGFLIGKFCFSFHYRSPYVIFTSLYIYSFTNLLFTSFLVCCCYTHTHTHTYKFQLEECSISKTVLDTGSHTLMCLSHLVGWLKSLWDFLTEQVWGETAFSQGNADAASLGSIFWESLSFEYVNEEWLWHPSALLILSQWDFFVTQSYNYA